MRKGLFSFLAIVVFIVIATSPGTSLTAKAATTATNSKSPVYHMLPSRSASQTRESTLLKASNRGTSKSADITDQLQYEGGPLITGTMQVYLIFWEPISSPYTNYNNMITRYFNDVGGSSLYQNLKQYPDASGNYPSGSQIAGSWIDHNSTLLNYTIYFYDIRQEIEQAKSINGWNNGPNTVFFVFLGKDARLCSDESQKVCTPNVPNPNPFCAVHNSYISGPPAVTTVEAIIPYAASPTFKGDCVPGAPHATPHGSSPNDYDADQTINLTSTEQMETATNPQYNGYVDNHGDEIGELCAWKFGPVNSHGADVVWNNNGYIVQEEWSNAIVGCTLNNSKNPFYQIVNHNSNLVLDIDHANKNTGAPVIQWGYHNALNEQWDLVPDGLYYDIINRNSRMFLIVYGQSQGENVVQVPYNDDLRRQWFLVPDGNYNQIVNVISGLVIDIFQAKTTSGAPAIQWTSHNGKNQEWSFVPISPYNKIQNVNSGMVLDLYQGLTTAGTNAIQWPYHNNNSQLWSLVSDGTNNGTPVYQIRSANSGLILDVANAGKTDGAPVVQWTNHNGTNQQWFVIPDGTFNGTAIYLIKNVNSGLVLDVFHARKTAGTQIVQWTNHNGSSQQWSITATSA